MISQEVLKSLNIEAAFLTSTSGEYANCAYTLNIVQRIYQHHRHHMDATFNNKAELNLCCLLKLYMILIQEEEEERESSGL